MSMVLKLIPLAVFLALAAFLAKGLQLDPSEIPSPLIGQPAPVFSAARLPATEGTFDSQSMQGEVWVLNIWASWCGPCVQEHPVLKALARERDVPIVGLNYKDNPSDALAWLQRLGDPFAHRVSDNQGDVGLDWGVYGVPETFVIDRQGQVRYKHVGPLDQNDLIENLLPVIDRLEAEPA